MTATGTIVPPLFEFTEEHRALRDMLRRWFDRATASADPAAGWRQLCGAGGIGDLLFGGADGEPPGTAIDLAILAEESGAALSGGPVLSAAVAAVLVEAAAVEGWPAVSALRAGTERPAVSGGLLGLSARPDALASVDAAQRLSGRIEPIWDISGATALLCTADGGGQEVVALVPVAATGVRARTLSGLDPSRPVGRAECTGAGTAFVLRGDEAHWMLERMRARAELVVAAESLGVAQYALDRTVDYARERVQFGRTIGSFQAVKHRLADVVAQVELTRSAVYAAAWGLTGAPEEPGTAIDLAVASALAADTAVTATKAAVQLHGGIAITWEHWAHRCLRRAHAVAALTGGAVRHLRRLADLLDPRDGTHEH